MTVKNLRTGSWLISYTVHNNNKLVRLMFASKFFKPRGWEDVV